MQETVNWSSELTLYRERWSGIASVMSEEWKAQYIKAGRLVLGGRCSGKPRGTPEARSCLFICQASFLLTFAMGGIPHAGSRQLANASCLIFLSGKNIGVK